MKREVRLLPVARSEFDDGVSWFDNKRAGLGNEFIGAVSEALNTISKTPFIYRRVYREVRATSVQGFPYQIFYRVLEDDSIEVLSVFQVRRSPAIWKDRSKS
jgi:toxin ParE1/3/4